MAPNILQKIRALGGEGILNEQDIAAFVEATQRVLALMADGCWHSTREICAAAGTNDVPATEGLRRMRELRRFFNVEKARDRAFRNFTYRLVFKAR
jgi:hypothetical protein